MHPFGEPVGRVDASIATSSATTGAAGATGVEAGVTCFVSLGRPVSRPVRLVAAPVLTCYHVAQLGDVVGQERGRFGLGKGR